MQIPCPHGRCKLYVEVYDGVCDGCDLCGRSACEFFDDTQEATERFIAASAHYATLEGFFETRSDPTVHLQRRSPEVYVGNAASMLDTLEPGPTVHSSRLN